MKGSKRKRIASSKGSKNVLQQTRKRKEKVVGNAVIDIQESAVISDITSSCPCKPPCLQRLFTDSSGIINFNQAVMFIKHMQLKYSNLSKDDQDAYIINQFKESIQNRDE
jgi:hypothetical protein